MSFTDSFRAWRRAMKAAMPYVRRREYRIVQRRHDALVDDLGWRSGPAALARLQTLKPIDKPLEGDVCLFVSHAAAPRLKHHVRVHIEQLLAAGIHVVLILNTDLDAAAFEIEPALQQRLAGAFVRENIGFDFGAWAHVFNAADRTGWQRLYLVNDSIVGPLNTPDFQNIVARIRTSAADLIGLTENRAPMRHLQSFFLVFGPRVLHSPLLVNTFERVLNLPTKALVIQVYELRLTQVLAEAGFVGEALFPALSNDPLSTNDTFYRWDGLITAGFPYIKGSVLDELRGKRRVAALVPAEFLQPPP